MRCLCAALLLAGFLGAQEDVKRLSPAEIKQLMQEKVFLLDVRSAEEIAEIGTLKGYVNIPIDQLEKRMSEIPKDKRIITA
jgi:rhodanese-related sulfurtransferase